MAGKKKESSNKNNGTSAAAEENAARSSTSDNDKQETPQRLTDTIPRFIADEYQVNTQVLCLYSGFYYNAKIIGISENAKGETLYKIHYQGWTKRYDEEITHADACKRFLVFSPENLALAKRELNEARTRKTSKSSNKKSEKKSKKEETEEKKDTTSQSSMANNEETREQTSNTGQDELISNQAEDVIEASSAEETKENEPAPTSSLVQNTEKENVVDFPENLLKALMDDYDLITRQKKLVKSPPRFTIDDVLLAYLKSASTPKDSDQLRRKLDVLVEFFNKMINMNLLYKAELQQHLDLLNAKRSEFGLEDVAMRDLSKYCDEFDGPRNTADGKENASKSKKKGTSSKSFMEKFHRENDYNFLDCYGFIHFIRFCYHYKCLLKNDANDEHEKYSKYAELIDDMIKFYNMNTKKYFIAEKDYESAC